MLKEEIKHIDKSDKAVKKTSVTIGIVLLIITFILWYFGKTSFIYFGAIGGIFIILSYIAVPLLRPIHKLWMSLALILGWFMSRVILIILFYLVIAPIGLFATLFGKRFLELKIDKSAKTYWEKRENIIKQPIDYERQF
ncbi:MAG TPA: SxtJ family membrane protein [Ignavibacteriaceae bacterium]|nr:SxtJ family membrane protein [Ignavibacteriaceae bacterium]